MTRWSLGGVKVRRRRLRADAGDGRRAGRAVGARVRDMHLSRPVRPHHDRDGPMSTPEHPQARLLVPALMFIALVVAAVASLGTPLITSVATTFHVSLDSAQWTLTIALLSGAVATPVLGRLGAGPHRRATILATLAVVVAGSALTVLPLPFAWLLAGRAARTRKVFATKTSWAGTCRGTRPRPALTSCWSGGRSACSTSCATYATATAGSETYWTTHRGAGRWTPVRAHGPYCVRARRARGRTRRPTGPATPWAA